MDARPHLHDVPLTASSNSVTSDAPFTSDGTLNTDTTIPADAQLRHQLRTPLNQVVGYAELLIEEAEDSGVVQTVPDLQRIQEAGYQLLDLLNQHFARQENRQDTEELSASVSTSSAFPLLAPFPTLEPREPDPRTLDAQASNIAAATTALLPPNIGEAKPACILVVDDEPANRDLLTRRLEHEGYGVVTAAGGVRALELMQETAFDLVLLDALMPDMSGIEVLQQIHTDTRLTRIPVIMLSALDDLSHVVRCIELGAEDYLPKPFNPIILRARIGASLEKKRLRDTEAQLFEQLRQGYDRLATLERWREDWTQMLVHDLRTPLTAILGSLQTLTLTSTRTDIPPQLHDDLVDISTHSAENMLALVNDLLDAAQLEEGAVKLNLAPVLVPALVIDVVAQMKPVALTREVELTTDFSISETLQVSADAQKIARVLVNLLANAIKFTPMRGLVTLGVAPHEDRVRFTVRDTGEGIPPAALSLIFQKFGQVEAKRAGHGGGTGLGLTFCKMVVEAHGGTIHVESKLGEGSIFFFELSTL